MARKQPLVLRPQEEEVQAEAVEASRMEAFLDEIDEMRGSGEFDWADQTLRDIYDWCRKAGRYTGKQVVAVNNIRFTRHWDELEGF